MIQKVGGGIGSSVRNREPSRPAELFSACSDQACLSPSVVGVPETYSHGAKEAQLRRVLDVSNLKPDQASQVLSELRSIPAQMWKLLADSGLRIVSLPPGQNLSQTSAVSQFSPQDYAERMQRASQALRDTIREQESLTDPADELQVAMWQARQGPILAELVLARSEGFKPVVLSRPVSAGELMQAAGSEESPEFLEDLRRLNGPYLKQAGELFESTHKVLLLPYPRRQGQPVPGDHLDYLKSQNSQALKAAMGTNYWQSSLVVVHQEFLPDPAPEAGHHRVLLHEVGHAIDHLIDRIQDDGLGRRHRATITELFERDKAAGAERFTSPRARDNVREYFAEAVESYLTRDRGDGYEPKPHNNHDWLKTNNPELFAHVDEIFTRQYAEHLSLEPMPERPEYKAPENLLVRFQKLYLEL
ncbi:MAG: hypothetical protein KF760_02670 [Candidatus Eremiobacteraeota bacterium]|nr:hypothetical protein [Candidatus Eremiobacteraeota bacterium]MCW5869468.1 hypothetical protein [Candidatus Eremiobacteraeota bacterium]